MLNSGSTAGACTPSSCTYTQLPHQALRQRSFVPMPYPVRGAIWAMAGSDLVGLTLGVGGPVDVTEGVTLAVPAPLTLAVPALARPAGYSKCFELA